MDNKLIRKAHKVYQKNKKRIYQSIKESKVPQSILFIVGCQRSGTSMIMNVLSRRSVPPPEKLQFPIELADPFFP